MKQKAASFGHPTLSFSWLSVLPSLHAHLGNSTFVLFTDPSFLPGLQWSVAPRPRLTPSLSSVFLSFALSLSCLHRGDISTMSWVLAEHLAAEPKHPDGQHVCSNNVGTQSGLAPARVPAQTAASRRRSFTVILCRRKHVHTGVVVVVRFELTAEMVQLLFKRY